MASRLIRVRVVTKAGFNRVKDEGDILKVYTTACPEKGKANKAVIKLIAQFLGKPASRVAIIRGDKSRDKVIQISD